MSKTDFFLSIFVIFRCPLDGAGYDCKLYLGDFIGFRKFLFFFFTYINIYIEMRSHRRG